MSNKSLFIRLIITGLALMLVVSVVNCKINNLKHTLDARRIAIQANLN